MRTVLAGLALLLATSTVRAASPDPVDQATIATYETLAQTIVALRSSETNLMKSILTIEYTNAQRLLGQPGGGTPGAVNVEGAAMAITNLANEGSKGIQAIRQRLVEAGHHHHHHTDAETDSDYVFVNATEKKALLDLAGEVAKLGGSATPAQLKGAGEKLTSLFDAALAAEE